MSEQTAFTPGPWRLGKYNSAVVADTKPAYRVAHALLIGNETVEESDRSEIAHYGGHLIAESICPEDAPLIAAAPDLYAALDEALAGDGHDESCGVWRVLTAKGPEAVEAACSCWVAIARRALAKARAEAVPA